MGHSAETVGKLFVVQEFTVLISCFFFFFLGVTFLCKVQLAHGTSR